MASKLALSNWTEVKEATQLISAFDRQNGIRSAIVLTVVERMEKPRLNVMCVPLPALTLEQAATLWGSPQFVREVDDLVSLMGVVMRALYGLDAELAEAEFAKLPGSKA